MMNGDGNDKISMEDATAAMDIADTATTENEPPPTSQPVENTSTTTNNNNDDDDTADMMDDINDDDDDDDDEDDDDHKQMTTEETTTPTSDETYVCQAIGLKEEGNQQFQNGDYNQASRSYRRGITALKKIKHQHDDQVKQLKLTLYTNWSTVSYKDQKYRVSVDMATKAIEIDMNHVKAMYRRALAYRKLGNLEEARTDLRNAITMEPNNTACRKELISVKKELEDAMAKQKKSLAKAFHSSSKNGSSFLYDDKEELAKQREMEELKKKKELEELQAKRKKQWEDECVSLMAKNETVLSFEEWDKQRQEKEDEEKKQKEKQRKAERKARKEERIKSSSSKSDKDDNGNDDDDDDIIFTEAELAAMRGYKKTSDGRTTSYFTRELSHEEKLQIGDIAPKRLLDTTNTNTNTNTNTLSCNGSNNVIPGLQPLSHASSSSPSTNATTTTSTTSASVWNQAGTWEEKNTTEWCQSQLKLRILETMTGNAILSTKITKVDDLNGDASVVVVSGKKRYIFDFNVKCKYQIYDNSKMDGTTTNKDDTDSGSSNVIASGTLRLPDICSTTHHDEVEVICESYKKVPPTHMMDMANTIRQMLIDQVRMQISLFVQDFNYMY